MNLGNAEENKLFVVKSDKKYFATADDIHPEIENNSLSYIVKAVMDNSTVLDVGCSYGYLGEWLAKNKNCQIYGIDIDEEALNYVKDRGYYKDVFHLDLDYPQNTKNEFERFGQLKEIFDFVICADVLEHLKDPTNALGFISSKLKFGGQVIVSIPNIAHMDIILNLLEGKFNYSEFGILDNTHLRFFTKKSFIEWIKNANELFKEKGFRFDIGYLGGTVYISKFLEDIKTKYGDLYNIILSGNHDLETLQHIFVLTKINGLANSYGLNKLLNDTDYANVFYIISSKIISLENELANKDSFIQELNSKNASLENELALKDTEIKNLSSELTNKDSFIQELNSKNVSLENELISVLLSRSWRYTRPIRKLLHKLADIDPIKHYILFNAKERRNPSPYFETSFYLDEYPDVAQSSINPLLHYISHGSKEGRWPNPEFDSGYYLLANPDVKKAGLNPLLHYIRYGQYEGRKTRIEESYKNISEVIDLLLSEPFIPRIKSLKPIDILIPVYNGREFLDSLFDSIIKNTSIPYRLLIANDKSTDPGISKYLADFKNNNPNIDINIIENEDNLGFVKTVNKLAKLTKNHFVILNTDTEVPPHWLERLIFPIISKENIASVTPFTNSGTICSFPEFLVDNPIFEDMDIATLDSYFQYVDFEKNYVEIPTAVGFCMAINKKVYDKIGLFDESFGKGYGEENDWSMRAAKAGYKNIIAPNLFVYHKHGGSFKSEEKKKLMDHNFALLRDKHPNYFLLVEDFIRKDPLKHLRSILKIRILSKLYKPVMIFDHSLGGGANEYTSEFLKDKNFAVVIKYDLNNKYLIEFLVKKAEKVAFEIDDIKEIEKIINYFNIEEIIINELVSYPKILGLLDFIVELKKNNNNINFIFMVHDYYCVCPMYNLLNYEKKYCNIPSNLTLCDKCIQENALIKTEVPKLDYPNLKISLWREKFNELLKYSSKIVCFSYSSKDIIQKTYKNLPESKFEIKPHTVDWVHPVVIRTTLETINIAILGHLGIHKGAYIVSSLINYIDLHNLNFKIHIFGNIIETYENFYSNETVVKHGGYKKNNLPKLMEENEIDIIFIPSIWPETFSYTTEEAIKMDMPVAVFDLGAPAERVKNYSKGIILENNDPEYIINKIFNFFKHNYNPNLTLKKTIFSIKNNEYAQEVGYLMDGIFYLRNGLIDKAKESFKLALEKNPFNIDALFCLGAFALKEENYIEAIDKFNFLIKNNLITHNVNLACVYNNLGIALIKTNRKEEGYGLIKKAHNLNNYYRDAIENLEKINKNQNDFKITRKLIV